MIFLELSLENFGPYQGKQVINLRPQIDEETRPIILFGGMNGDGKTTLMDAIRLCLYGNRAQCSTRGNLSYNDFLSQCANRHTPPLEKTRIELAFEHVLDDRLTQYKIVRYWEKHDTKDTLGILVYDGHHEWWPDKAIASTWDEYIETLLPLGISNLFLFDGEQVKELAEMETPPDFVIGAIKSLLGLELAERLSVDLDIFAGRKRKEIAGAKDKDTLDKIEATFEKLLKEKDQANDEIRSNQGKLEQAEKYLKEASNRFISEGGKIAGERSYLDQQLKDGQKQAESKRQAMVQLSAGFLPLGLISPLLEQAKTQAEMEANQFQAKIAKTAVEQRSERLLKYLTELSLKPKQLQQIQSFIAQEDADFTQLAESGEPWLDATVEAIAQLDTILGYEIKASQAIAIEKIKELKEAESEIDVVERQLDKAASPEAYEKLETAVRECQKQVTNAQTAWEIANRKVTEIDREIAKTHKELEEYSQDYLKHRNNQHTLQAIAKAQSTLKLFKEKLTLKKLNKLEVEITECFRYLLHKSDLVHRVAIDTQTFALSIYDPQGKLVPKHRLSAGEKQLLAIAFLWGLARVSGRHLPIAIDTPLGRLDSSHRNNLIEKYFPSASHQVILLSTDTEIAQIEYEQLKKLDAIAHTYLLKYDSVKQQTIIEENSYFW
jgi:DNA sulfur modification protein DndD